jgi:hypothetical protein
MAQAVAGTQFQERIIPVQLLANPWVISMIAATPLKPLSVSRVDEDVNTILKLFFSRKIIRLWSCMSR